MVYGHFAKAALEAISPGSHLAGRTVSMNRTAWGALFYWIGLGAIVGFSLFHPELVEEEENGREPRSIISRYIPASFFPVGRRSKDADPLTLFAQVRYQVLVLVFILAEFMNLQCHLHYYAEGKR